MVYFKILLYHFWYFLNTIQIFLDKKLDTNSSQCVQKKLHCKIYENVVVAVEVKDPSECFEMFLKPEGKETCFDVAVELSEGVGVLFTAEFVLLELYLQRTQNWCYRDTQIQTVNSVRC